MKKKKMTREEAHTILRDLSGSLTQEIVDSGYVTTDEIVTIRKRVEKGTWVVDTYCHHCGNERTEVYNYGRLSTYCSCGCVHKFKVDNMSDIERQNTHAFIKKMDNGFCVAKFVRRVHFPRVVDWHRQTPTFSVDIRSIVLYDNDSDFFVYNAHLHKMVFSGYDYESLLNSALTSTPINTTDVHDWKVLIADAQSAHERKVAEKEAKKARSKGALLAEMMEKYKPQSICTEDFFKNIMDIPCYIYNNDGVKKTFMAHCSTCGHEFTFDVDENVNLYSSYKRVCPHCGAVDDSRLGNGKGNGTVVVFENTTLPDNDLLIRYFQMDTRFNVEQGYSRNVVERERVFAGKKLHKYDQSSTYDSKIGTIYTGTFEKSDMRSARYLFSDCQKTQTNDEIAEIIRSSCLAHSGLVEAYGLGDKRYTPFEKVGRLDYLFTWYKNPGIELVLKSNMTRAMKDIVHRGVAVEKGSNLSNIFFGAPNAVIKMAVKGDLNVDDINNLNRLYQLDQSLTMEQYSEMSDLSAVRFAELKRIYGVSYTNALRYIQNAYDHQCIEKNEVLTLWLDYLRMATTLKMDLKDKSRLYPTSLKKEHDVAVFAYRAVKVELDKKEFENNAEKNAYYEYSYKDLMVRIPKTPEEIVEEATRQKNCLRSYVDRVRRGDTVVAFVRYKEHPESTYVTAEINDNKLIQLKGYANTDPRTKELNEFVDHWSKAKKFSIRC